MSPRPRAAESRRQGVNSFRCRVCRGVHALRKCQRFLKLSAEKRLRAVLINKYCPNCLAHQHSGQSCRSGGRCRECNKDHHTLLHFFEQGHISRTRTRSLVPRTRSPPPRTRSSPPRTRSPRPRPSSSPAASRLNAAAPTTSLTSLLQLKSTSILPTALVLIDAGNKTFEICALIDPCCPLSSINASLATALGLSVTRIGAEGACTAFIRSKIKEDVKLEVVFKTEAQLQIRTPSKPVGEHVKEEFANITLADAHFNRQCTVSVVLGAEVFQDIILPGVIPSHDGLPVAQNTVFGWVLSGTCSR